ncbi:MAG: hypothetical protein JRD02_12975, partial [Deltaproteobacteria bacterium]|nr:hypothetical protein [Deltaproteobacteria bacterium]
KRAITPVDVQMINYHVREIDKSLEEFTRRLYLKNPKYEKDPEARHKKIQAIFHGGEMPVTEFNDKPSHEVLAAAFESDSTCSDRIFLLGLGLKKSVREAYSIEEDVFITSLQIRHGRLENLYVNINQVNWRLKVYRDEDGRLLFLTNEAGEGGYINMGYEVIMTEVLTRIKDDIYLRGGTPPKFAFSMASLFLVIFF